MATFPESKVWQNALPPQKHSSTPDHFHTVTNTLLHNPNVTSSLLFRAEIFYDSQNDHTSAWDAVAGFQSDFTKHMKAELRPRGLNRLPNGTLNLCLPDLQNEAGCDVSTNWRFQRLVVRNLVPRNPERDRPLVQSCWYLESIEDGPIEKAAATSSRSTASQRQERHLVVYVPHAETADDVPYYHPSVKGLAMLYSWIPPTARVQKSPAVESPAQSSAQTDQPTSIAECGTLHVLYCYFPSSEISNRLSRTALMIQTTIVKHMAGRAAGYVKRVHHDQVVPQKAFQDTYTYLKLKYAKDLVKNWAEQTDPTKHVFEDLGIAAFMIELWKEMYGTNRESFPGFVDCGCGNGLLVYLLNSEGYEGWGFDVRKRKSWDALPQAFVGGRLKELACVPRVLLDALPPQDTEDLLQRQNPGIHDGTFKQGTFIISNHADELTGWTPLLACLSDCPFVAIPCCSHDFGGKKFRAKAASSSAAGLKVNKGEELLEFDATQDKSQAAETGRLKKHNPKQPSAYATLCGWLEYLTGECGFAAEKEMLRIPSTRNAAILGRTRKTLERNGDTQLGVESLFRLQSATHTVKGILEAQMSMDISLVARDWVDRTRQLSSSKNSGH